MQGLRVQEVTIYVQRFLDEKKPKRCGRSSLNSLQCAYGTTTRPKGSQASPSALQPAES